MTLEEFYKATEGMPKDAEIKYIVCGSYDYDHQSVDDVVYAEYLNEILLC